MACKEVKESKGFKFVLGVRHILSLFQTKPFISKRLSLDLATF